MGFAYLISMVNSSLRCHRCLNTLVFPSSINIFLMLLFPFFSVTHVSMVITIIQPESVLILFQDVNLLSLFIYMFRGLVLLYLILVIFIRFYLLVIVLTSHDSIFSRTTPMKFLQILSLFHFFKVYTLLYKR